MHSVCMYLCLFLILWSMLAGITQGFEIPCNVSTPTLQIVGQCPTDEEGYKEAAAKKNCTSIGNTCDSFVYHCVMNAWRNATVEVCAPSLSVVGHVCGEYSEYFMSIRSSERSCKNFRKPCPFKYNSTDQYKFPGCYSIYKANTSVYMTSTDLPQMTVYRKSITTSSQSTFRTLLPMIDVPSKNNHKLSAGGICGIITAVIVFIFICLFVIFFAYVRRKMRHEQKSCKQVITTIPFCCQRFHEASIMLKMQNFMDKRYGRVDVCDQTSQSTLVVTPGTTTSDPLLSNIENENFEMTQKNDECDVSVGINEQQKIACFPQNQPDASTSLTTTAEPLELKSAAHPSNEHVTPTSTSVSQKFDCSSPAPLDLSLQSEQQSEASSSASSHKQDIALNSPQLLQIHRNSTQTEQLGSPLSTSDSVSNPVSMQNSSSSKALDQLQDTSSTTLQSEPLDLSISSSENQRSPLFYLDEVPSNSSNLSIDCTPVSVSTNLLDDSQISTSQQSEVSPVTSTLLSSNVSGSDVSDTTQKKVVKSVSPESPEASSELVPTGPPPSQHKIVKQIIKLGNTSTETSQKTPNSKLSTSKKAGGRGFSDRMHEGNTEEKLFGNAANNRDVHEPPMEVNVLDLENISGATPIPDSDELKENSTRKEAMEYKLDTVIASVSQLQLSLMDVLSDLKSTREELKDAKEELRAAEKKFETAAEELRQTRDQLQAQHRRMVNKDREIEDLRVEICEKDRLLCEKDRTVKAQQQELLDKDRTINDRDRIINEKQRQNLEVNKELNEKERKVRKREEELKALRDRIRQLEEQQHEGERKVESLERELRRKKKSCTV